MSQNRKAPSYQEYASDILAQLSFRTITLQDRGLLWTMRMECWVNKQLPNDPETLAKALGLPANEVIDSFPSVMTFFKVEGDFIVCPELEDYRYYLEERKRKQSEGGKTGIIITNEKRKTAKLSSIDNTTTLSSNLQVPLQGTDKSRVESSTVEQSQVQPSREEQTVFR